MTPQQILDASRNNLSALNDTNWTDPELLVSLYQVMLEMGRETQCIEGTDSQNTVAAQADYAAPANAIEIWRVTYNGTPLSFIDQRRYDTMNPNNVTSAGSPSFYLFYEDTITLYPIPTDVAPLKVWSYDEPAVPTAASTLEVPAIYHDVLVKGLTKSMCPKDLGHPLTAYFAAEYEKGKLQVKEHIRRKKRANKFTVARTEERSLSNDFGII